MKNFLALIQRTQKHTLFSNFISEYRALHEINLKIYGGNRNTINGYVICRMGFECWTPNAIETNSKCVCKIIACTLEIF
jgi:hypothetical protein